MTGKNKIIPRSDYEFNREDLMRLVELHNNFPWVIYENEAALYSMWHDTDSEIQKELLEFLISHYTYIDTRQLLDAMKSVVNQIVCVWKLSSENTIVSAMCDNSKPDGSQMALQQMKNQFPSSWKDAMYNAITTTANESPNDMNIVLVDDFIGTGNTTVRKVDYVRRTFVQRGIENYRIYVCSIAAMTDSRQVISPHVDGMFAAKWLDKGISVMAPKDKVDSYKKHMLIMEGKLKWSKFNQRMFSFGYGQSETLFSLPSTNIPNNVFPIFWWRYSKEQPNEERKTIFKRI